MFRRMFALPLAAVLLPGCADLLGPKPEMDDWRGVQVGVVTQLNQEQVRFPQALIEMFLEEDPGIPLVAWAREPDSSFKTIWYIFAETEIFRQAADGSLVRARLDEVKAGSVVRAETTHPYLLSLPPKAYADRIVLISPSQ